MRKTFFLLGVLFAAPLFAQRPVAEPHVIKGQVEWMGTVETRQDAAKLLGPPAMVSEFDDFIAWQYQMGDIDHHDFSHYVLFRKSTGKLVSITRNYDPERSVDELFPATQTKVYFHSGVENGKFGVRLRRLEGGRLIMAIGSVRAGQPAEQLVLIAEAELPHFFEWLADQIRVELHL